MFKQLTKLLSGSALGQLIAFLFIPILTHVYEPDVFGQYQVAFSVATFLAIVLTFKLEIALPTVTEQEAQGMAFSIGKLVLFNVLVLALVMVILSQYTKVLPAVVSSDVLLASVVMATLIALNNIARFLLIGANKFGTISITLFSQSGGRSVLQWLLAWASQLGLIIGDLLARLAMVIISVKAIRFNVQTNSIFTLLKQHWRYPIWVMPSTLLNNSMAVLLLPVIAYQFGAVEAGVVAVAYRLITAPNSLIGAALADVLFAQFTEQAKQGKFVYLQTQFSKYSLLLILLSILIFACVYLLSPLLGILVDVKYQQAQDYLILLLPWFAAQFAVAPISRVIFIFDQQLLKLVFDVMVGLNLLWQVYIKPASSVADLLSEISISMACLYCIYLLLLHAIVRFSVKAQECKSE